MRARRRTSVGAAFASHRWARAPSARVGGAATNPGRVERFASTSAAPRIFERVVFRVIPAEATRLQRVRGRPVQRRRNITPRAAAARDRPTSEIDEGARRRDLRDTIGTPARSASNVDARAVHDAAAMRRAIAHAIDPSIIVDRLIEGCVRQRRRICPPVGSRAAHRPPPREAACRSMRARSRTLWPRRLPGRPRARPRSTITSTRATSPAHRRGAAGPA